MRGTQNSGATRCKSHCVLTALAVAIATWVMNMQSIDNELLDLVDVDARVIGKTFHSELLAQRSRLICSV